MIYAPLLTPIHPDLTVDCESLYAHAVDLMERGCKGIVLFGTTGEGSSFSQAEKSRAFQKLVTLGIDPDTSILANGASSIADTVALMKNSCLAHLICPPSFYKKVSDTGVIAYYREILLRTKGSVILYHIPQYSGVPITLDVIGALIKEFPTRILGLKESEGNPVFAKQVIDQFPELKVFIAKEGQIIEMIRYGAFGVISGIINIAPELISSLPTLQRNPPELEKLQEMFQGGSFIPQAKALLAKAKGAHWRLTVPPI